MSLHHHPFTSLAPESYGETAKGRRRLRLIEFRAQRSREDRERALAAGYGDGFAMRWDGRLRCVVNKGKTAHLDLETALVSFILTNAEQFVDGRRYGRVYQCDVDDMLDHWHVTHWQADPPRGHAWPSPFWPAPEVDPHLL